MSKFGMISVLTSQFTIGPWFLSFWAVGVMEEEPEAVLDGALGETNKAEN